MAAKRTKKSTQKAAHIQGHNGHLPAPPVTAKTRTKGSKPKRDLNELSADEVTLLAWQETYAKRHKMRIDDARS